MLYDLRDIFNYIFDLSQSFLTSFHYDNFTLGYFQATLPPLQ